MPNEFGELTAAEKHEQARAYALSGSLSKFQQTKQKKKAMEKVPVKASKTITKRNSGASSASSLSASSYQAAAPSAVTTKQEPSSAGDNDVISESSEWPQVEDGEYQYVYITSGPFEGKFGYYDDQEGSNAIIYFGAPLLGEGPYEVPLHDLRKPPAKYCTHVFQAI